MVAVAFSLFAFAMPLGPIVAAIFVTALLGYVYLAFRQEKAAAPSGHGVLYDKSLALQEPDVALATPAAPSNSLLIRR